MVKVSVIVPVYNSEDTIERCVYSLLEQTFWNIEILLINDGSSDSSGEICDLLSKKDKRIVVIHQENKGVSSTRNIGINNATGEFIQFVDSDDFVEVNMVEKLVGGQNDFERYDLTIAGFFEHNVGKSDSIITRNITYGKSANYSREEFLSVFHELHAKRLLSAPWNSLYNRDIIINNNIKFSEEINYGEDTLFNLKYYKYCKKISIIDSPLYHYVHTKADSLSSKYNPNKLNTVNEIYKNIRSLLIERNKYNNENLSGIERSYFYHALQCIELSIHHVKYMDLYIDTKKAIINKDMQNAAKTLIKEKNISLRLLAFLVRKQATNAIILFLMSKRLMKEFV